MAHRTNPADARHQRRHLRERPPFAEFFKAAELGYVKTSIFDLTLLIKVQRDFGMALNPCDRINNDRSLSCAVHFRLQSACVRSDRVDVQPIAPSTSEKSHPPTADIPEQTRPL